ncbi:MAG: hypothetical protein M0Z66_09480 [Thermaerobacter sp.]|nr:hypothetical protein [Thermaerobacter sp.]
MTWRLPRIHPLLLALVALGVVMGRTTEIGVYIVSLLLHEAAHAAAARSLGYEMGRVELYPFGGRADIPGIELRGPLGEMVIAAAGPLANLVALAAATALWRLGLADALRVRMIVDANLAMLLVNALPAFPLDGGRVLRAVSAARVGFSRASEAALQLTQWICVLLLPAAAVVQLLGLPGWQLAVLSLVLFSALRRETARVPLARWTLWLRGQEDLRGGGILPLQAFAAGEGAQIRQVLRRLFGRRAHRIYVYDRDRMLGTLDDHAIYRAAQRGELQRTLGEIVRERNDG